MLSSAHKALWEQNGQEVGLSRRSWHLKKSVRVPRISPCSCRAHMPSDSAMLAMLRLHQSIRHLLIRADADHRQLIRSSCSGMSQRSAARFAAAAVMPSSHPHGSEPIVLREGNDQTILQPPGPGLTARLLLGLLLRPGHPQLHPSSPAPPQCTPSILPGTLLASQAAAVASVLHSSHRPEVRDDLAQSRVLNPKLGGFLAI
mmetsp:Transcript_87927/g.223821  ORF Transcript_87927/g.223821 Transcript_87927/m.223821 type:complete len:202 (-) Transcript_87927:655-1260(-)